MRFLLLNTCGAQASAALADSTLHAPIVGQEMMPGRTASERMVAAVREMLKVAVWRLSDLAAIGVVTGPGSFTGVRVGLSVAKGLGETSGVPLIAISRLALLAAAEEPQLARVCALLDAGRGEFYCGEFVAGEAPDERLISRDQAFVAMAAAGRTMVCEAVVFEALKGGGEMRMVADPTAVDALPFALARFAKEKFDDPMTLDANYLRRTDVEIFAKPTATRSG